MEYFIQTVYAGQIPLVLLTLSEPQHPKHINISTSAEEVERASCFLKSQLRQSTLDTPLPPFLSPAFSSSPVVQTTRNWSAPLWLPNVLYCHWSEAGSEGMYWTMRVLVPACQAMCQYARVCVLGEKQKQDIFAILYMHTYIFIYIYILGRLCSETRMCGERRCCGRMYVKGWMLCACIYVKAYCMIACMYACVCV